MNIVKKIYIFHFLIIILKQLCFISSNKIKKEEMGIMDLLPSNSLLYPLDFQQNWQASEPIPLNIHYDVPSYGHKDLLTALEYHNDLENYEKEREEIKRKIIAEQNRLEEFLWNKIEFLKIKERNLQNQNFLRTHKNKI
ncbi:conserved Plasmodium protein, unknown function [Plasmodium malariae]|uniref:Uncharacterized protein n=1 Tax=Plasmodium malariae TaxID=5858 RepID=A0A1D3TDA6_PLAMA|nr:conserved Plasmodium protein, unknown function [Plasmodium malariae]SCP02770.1 conserved Plasmodium protein, unknown function [Plasmodium malariae]